MLCLVRGSQGHRHEQLPKIGGPLYNPHDYTHLSKRPSDLKQNGTQEKTPFSSTVFHTLSYGVIRFVASVSSKNHLLTG